MRLYFCLILALCASLYAKADTDYTTGVIFINEDWYGHRNSTVNYLQPDDPEGQYWHYRIIKLKIRVLNWLYQPVRCYMARPTLHDCQAGQGPRCSCHRRQNICCRRYNHENDKAAATHRPFRQTMRRTRFLRCYREKGYVSSSNGIWKLNLETLEIEGQVEGTANPNAGDDKPKTPTPRARFYVGQTGTMILVGDKVFAVHQQYGMLVIRYCKRQGD